MGKEEWMNKWKNNDRINTADEKERWLFTTVSLKKIHVPSKHSFVQLGPILYSYILRENVEIRVKMPYDETGCFHIDCQHKSARNTHDDLSNHAHTFAWTKTAKSHYAQSQSLPSNNQNVRSDDSLASGWLKPILIETVEWKRHSWQRCTKISQKPRCCSFPRPAELYFNLYQYKVCVCSCTCCILSSKTCIQLAK